MGTEINCTYKCSGCRFYKAYYSKGASAFYREKAGYCERKGTAVNAKGYCVLYKNRPKGEKAVSAEHLDESIALTEELRDKCSGWDF